MKSKFIASVIAAAAVAVMQSASAAELIVGTNGKPGNPRVTAAEMFGALLAQSSKGRHTVKVAHSASLGDDRQMLKSVRLGTMHITVNSDGPVAEIVPDLNAFGLPYLFSDLTQAWEVLDGPIGDSIAAKLEAKGYVVLAWWDNGIRKITHVSKPIAHPDDIKGMKIRTPQSQVTIDAFRALGANPAPLAFSELPAAARFNEVDTAAFKAATAGVYEKWADEIGDIVPRIQQAAARAGQR